MYCVSCRNKLNGNEIFCPNCGQKIETIKKNKSKKYLIYVILIISIILMFSIVFLIFSNNRRQILNNLSPENKIKISIDNNEFYLGDNVSSYIEKGYSYNQNYISDEDYIEKDSINIQSFSKERQQKFLATLYCANNKKCQYKDSIILKINFYQDDNIIIDDYLKYGMTYDKVVEKYGKETGKFYQDENVLIWAIGEGKIGQPYYALKFESSWFSKKKITEIRIGIWWYEDEYERTVIVEEA